MKTLLLCDCGRPKSKKKTKKCLACLRDDINQITKGELLNTIKNGRWDLYRVTLQKRARASFKFANKLRKCIICNYSKTVDIAHIKAVADFSDDAKLSEINASNNLVALCPNHHWEFDNNQLPENEKTLVVG